jgi:hypothetical protein
MTTLLASRRRVGWVRSVLLVATLVVAVLIHHGIEHGASTASGEATAMPGMTAVANMASHDRAASVEAAQDQAAQDQGSGTSAEASNAHMGCAGDQMCEAFGIAKTPSTAHPMVTGSRIDPPQPHLMAGLFRHEPSAASSPPTSAVLRI